MIYLYMILAILTSISCKTTDNSKTAAIIGDDDRVIVTDVELKQITGYIQVDIGGEKKILCNGFFTGPNQVTTAAHCLRPQDISQGNFFTGSGSPYPITRLVFFDQESDEAIFEVEGQSKLYLTKNKFDGSQPIEIVSFDPAQNKLVKNGNSQYQRLDTPGYLQHSLDTVTTSSGSPLIQNGRYVGIHIGTLFESDLGAASANPLSKEHELAVLKVIQKNSWSKEDKNVLEAVLFNGQKLPKLLGNIARIFDGEAKVSLAKLKNRVSFESLVGGANDFIVFNVMKSSGYFGKEESLETRWDDETERMLVLAGHYAVNNGFNHPNIHECAVRNLSDFAKSRKGEIPTSSAKLFQFMSRPTFGPSKNLVSVMAFPLDPAEFPCPELGSYVAGRAFVNSYSTWANDYGTYHVFKIGINRECADKQTNLTKTWANTIGHEMLHVLGQRHSGTTDDPNTYIGRYVSEYGHCIEYGPDYRRATSIGLTGSSRRLQ